jgi:hypothetical protein
MVHTLPRLLTKYAPDAGRIAEVLQIPPLMNLQVYSELRILKVRELIKGYLLITYILLPPKNSTFLISSQPTVYQKKKIKK